MKRNINNKYPACIVCFFFLFDSRSLREEAKHSCRALQPELHLGEGIAAWDLRNQGVPLKGQQCTACLQQLLIPNPGLQGEIQPPTSAE